MVVVVLDHLLRLIPPVELSLHAVLVCVPLLLLPAVAAFRVGGRRSHKNIRQRTSGGGVGGVGGGYNLTRGAGDRVKRAGERVKRAGFPQEKK